MVTSNARQAGNRRSNRSFGCGGSFPDLPRKFRDHIRSEIVFGEVDEIQCYGRFPFLFGFSNRDK